MQKREKEEEIKTELKSMNSVRERGTDAWDRAKAHKRGKETLHDREEEKACERE